MHWLQLIFKCIYLNYPPYLKQYFVPYSPIHQVRHSVQIYFSVPSAKKLIGRRAFMFKAPTDWNTLPAAIRSLASLGIFKHALLSHFQLVCTCYNWYWWNWFAWLSHIVMIVCIAWISLNRLCGLSCVMFCILSFCLCMSVSCCYCRDPLENEMVHLKGFTPMNKNVYI